MKPPAREVGQVLCLPPGREGELEPRHPTHAWSRGSNASIPRQPGDGRRQTGGRSRRAPLSPNSRLPASATYSHSAKEPSCLSRDLRSPTAERDQLGDSSAAGRRHRAGKARRAAPRSEHPSLAGTPWSLRSASVPARRARLRFPTAVPAKAPPLAP